MGELLIERASSAGRTIDPVRIDLRSAIRPGAWQAPAAQYSIRCTHGMGEPLETFAVLASVASLITRAHRLKKRAEIDFGQTESRMYSSGYFLDELFPTGYIFTKFLPHILDTLN
jgi:hypothetical protein